MANQSESSSSPISLPKGGGAIKGIGETFQPNLFSGTGNFSVPIFTSSGRSGFNPQLTLQYSTGNGNGAFGVGWQLSLPRVTRKTEKGLPTYTSQDVFVMSGAEDLVPYLQQDNQGQWKSVETSLQEFNITQYRPRTEGQFTRIERWENKQNPDDTHWSATTKENVTSIYGRTASARITDPQNPTHIYEWLLEETFDVKGNHMLYEYIQEDAAIQLSGIHEQNRSYTQTYIRRILYGNTPENLNTNLKVGPVRTVTNHNNPLETLEQHYLFEVLFDYETLNEDLNIAADLSHDKENMITTSWPVREDPFSTYRSGFEIRTLRRCRRVLMRHHFKEGELIGTPLVKSTDFQYTVNADTKLSFLSSATISGYRKDPNNPNQYLKRNLPPVTFKYSKFEPSKQRYQSVTAKGSDMPPRSLNDPKFTFMDIHGNGLQDIVEDTGNGLHYWENLGQGKLDHRHPQSGSQPTHSFTDANVSLGDMGGDGLADLIVDDPPVSGFYESTPDGHWKTFKRFKTMPSFNLSDPNTRLMDLTGDGLSDVLVTRNSHFLWYRSLGEEGYADPHYIPRKHDLDIFPNIFFDDSSGRVRLADMTGDGLTDIVRIHDGRIDYWPNLGYGNFGKRITMANTPRIGYGFNPRRLFLADLDGSGSTDLVYIEHCKVRFWFNQSGNAWSNQQTVDGTPAISDHTAIQFTDFYGTGTTTLLWSYDHGQHPGGSNYKILDFCGGNKPNLLVEMDNNMGATTRVQYAPSTKFYLEDKANGNPWHTSLPFPVQVLEKTEVIDHISKTKLVTQYKYHHGYYDGREREFRGFGRVDQIDTEFFEDFSNTSLHGDEISFDNKQKGFHIPPVETRTWFHTGVYFDEAYYLNHRDLNEQNRREYYSGDPEAFQLEEAIFKQPDNSDGFGELPHEAFRALRGAVLRSEVYAHDNTDKSIHPYTVSENRYQIKALQPRKDNHHAVYLSTNYESLSYHYERNPADPRINHSITLNVDDFGNVTDNVAIAYPRRTVPDDVPEQGKTHIIYNHTDFINTSNLTSANTFYYAGIPFQTRQYEVTGIDHSRYQADHFTNILDTSKEVDLSTFKPYEWVRTLGDTSSQRRIIEWTRSYFRKDVNPDNIDFIGNLDHRLLLGEIEPLALPYEAYQAAFSESLLQGIYGSRLDNIDLATEGGYHPHSNHAMSEGDNGIENYWWIPSGRQNFNPDKFLQNEQAQDPFGSIATTATDAYALMLETAKDALPAPLTNEISAQNNYRVLQAFEITDPNDNKSQVAFDALGLVVGTAIMGEDNQGNTVGDSLEGFIADLDSQTRKQHINDPLNLDATNNTNPHNILKKATTRLVYDLERYSTTGEPNVVYSLARETHVSAENGTPSKIQHAFTYSDGFGRESQQKVQAEPDATQAPIKPRWVGTGTIIYNNKGKAVQQYEPFFSNDHHHGIEQHGVSPTLFYDPLERVICTVQPNHSYEKVIFNPWKQVTWDSNDTLLLDPRTDDDVTDYTRDYFIQFDQEFENEHGTPPQTWYQQRIQSNDPAKKAVAQKTESHANTPTVAHLDTLGRPVRTIADNGLDAQDDQQHYLTRVVLDIDGNQIEVIDARGLVVMHYDYDMTRSGDEEDEGSNLIHQNSMDAGNRWILSNVIGKSIRSWDSRNHALRTTFDELQRPTALWVKESNNTEVMAEQMIYGEAQPDAKIHNLKSQLYQQKDDAGIVTNKEFDFKANPLVTTRELLQVKDLPPLQENRSAPVDWSQLPEMEGEVFSSSVSYDALNRPIKLTTPHSPTMQASIIRPEYNEANLLDKVSAKLQGNNQITVFVKNIDYSAKGQREKIVYGSNVSTSYHYEADTFRLERLLTQRGNTKLQDLNYTYDPVGNISEIIDNAQQTEFFNKAVISPSSQYEYDPIYRLIQAEGREHSGLGADTQRDHKDISQMSLLHANDVKALRRYTQTYNYDEVGNIMAMIHRHSDNSRATASGNWARQYEYATDSNRLLATSHPQAPFSTEYLYDAHGSITKMSHLPVMEWGFKDQLQLSQRQIVGAGNTAEQTRYLYDAGGERVRKITTGQNGNRKNERLYLGGFEIYREYEANGTSIKLERETLHIMDGQQRISLIETKTIDSSILNLTPSAIIRYQLGNHLGSSSLELDRDGAVISYEEYHPYGTSAYRSGRSVAEVSLKRYRFTGKERDEETGFSYHSARYYLPWLGRWGSVDPAGLVDEANIYLYVGNNPISYWDPNGEEKRNFWIASTSERNKYARSTPLGKKHGWLIVKHSRIDESNFYSAHRTKSGHALYFDTSAELSAEIQSGIGPGNSRKLNSGLNSLQNFNLGQPVSDQSLRYFYALESAKNGNKFAAISQISEAWAAEHTLENYALGTVYFAASVGSLGVRPKIRSSTTRSPVKKPGLKKLLSDERGGWGHGNSLNSTKAQHLYEIIDRFLPLDKLYKYGISGQKLLKSGQSARANLQVNALNKANPVPAGQTPRFSSNVLAKDIPGRRAALSMEQHGVNSKMKQPQGNKKPLANSQYGPGAR